ncbi:hypothetical protein GLOIN_2v1668464, partial [Rhizophagus irregularis DAOM 181602=DAOM 197198]
CSFSNNYALTLAIGKFILVSLSFGLNYYGIFSWYNFSILIKLIGFGWYVENKIV